MMCGVQSIQRACWDPNRHALMRIEREVFEPQPVLGADRSLVLFARLCSPLRSLPLPSLTPRPAPKRAQSLEQSFPLSPAASRRDEFLRPFSSIRHTTGQGAS